MRLSDDQQAIFEAAKAAGKFDGQPRDYQGRTRDEYEADCAETQRASRAMIRFLPWWPVDPATGEIQFNSERGEGR